MKKYITVKENPGKITHLKIELDYNLGGMNYFTGQAEERGYYLSVCPVKRSLSPSGYMLESYGAFTGIKKNIKPVKRRSVKAEAEAEYLVDTELDVLIDYVCKKNSIEIDENKEVLNENKA